ncbi:MAG: ATP12 family chaperone protein [Tagaea sp.]
MSVVHAEPALIERPDGAFGVALDGKPVRTPAGTEIATRARALAEALVAEWRGRVARVKAPKIDYDKLPLTRIVGTALDRIPPKREAVLDEMLAHAETELLCFRAAEPPALVERQAKIWQPLLDWLALSYDAPLVVAHGSIVAPAQPASSLAALRKSLGAMDDLKLAGIGVAIAASGSLVVSLALADGRIDAAGAFEAAELDATFQIERWGEDSEATAKRARTREELIVAQRFFGLAQV